MTLREQASERLTDEVVNDFCDEYVGVTYSRAAIIDALQPLFDQVEREKAELRMGHVRLDECSDGKETAGKPLYDRIGAKILKFVKEREEHRLQRKAAEDERDSALLLVNAAQHRQGAAQYTADRLALENLSLTTERDDLRAKLTQAEADYPEAMMRCFIGWLTADIPELHAVEVPRLDDSLRRFLSKGTPVALDRG